MKILPSKRSAAGEGDREAVEGATAHSASGVAPSTILRMVPLTREGRGRIE
jgi:hypothetical protein